MDTTHAQDVLDLFSQYAQLVVSTTQQQIVPMLCLFYDGSGHISNGRLNETLWSFYDVADLLSILQGRVRDIEAHTCRY